MTATPKVPYQVEMHRLSTEAYQQLEKTMPPLVVSLETTPHYAGYMLGVQFVLKKLREGFVVG